MLLLCCLALLLKVFLWRVTMLHCGSVCFFASCLFYFVREIMFVSKHLCLRTPIVIWMMIVVCRCKLLLNPQGKNENVSLLLLSCVCFNYYYFTDWHYMSMNICCTWELRNPHRRFYQRCVAYIYIYIYP